MEKTSQTHPLRLDWVAVATGGRIGMTFCPGKVQPQAWTGAWRRDLATDLAAIQRWGASTLVTLLEEPELVELGVTELGRQAQRLGLRWHFLPMRDQCAPDHRFEAIWPTLWPELARLLLTGGSLVLHCKGGLGRTGTVAACLLRNFGDSAACALARVRLARPGAVETPGQEQFIQAWQPQPLPAPDFTFPITFP